MQVEALTRDAVIMPARPAEAVEAGDIVSIRIAGWLEGEHEIRGEVIQLYEHDRARVRMAIGTQSRDFSVERAALTLIERPAR